MRSIAFASLLTLGLGAASGVAADAPVAAESTMPAQTAGSAERAPLRLALHSDAALGLSRPSFYNHLLGPRLDWQLAPTLALGFYLGYGNLEGHERRAHSALMALLFEHRIALEATRVSVPMRLSLGYLVRNGAFLRVGSGLAVPLSDSLELLLDLPAPALWVAQRKVLVSLNLGLELGFRL